MQVQEEAYFNFVNSINSDVTRKNYEYLLSRFLKYCNLDLDSLLKLSQQDLSNLIIKYLVSQKISTQYKTVIMASIKHACEMNDVILNWKKLKKFIKSEKKDNETNGKDRGYTHKEIQTILEFSDQRLKTAFLILESKISSGGGDDVNVAVDADGNTKVTAGGGDDDTLIFDTQSGKVNCGGGEDTVTLENSPDVKVSKNCENVQTTP